QADLYIKTLVSLVGDSFAISGKVGEDLVGGLRPDVGTGVCFPVLGPGCDVCLECFDAWVGAALELLGREFGEPALDEVEPGAALRDEVEQEARVAEQPASNRGRLVRRVVVEDQMHLELGGHGLLE